jgi:hypothetical protein
MESRGGELQVQAREPEMTQPASTESKRGEELQRTRQQLKELDNLLEQMLALPISDRPPRQRYEESPPAPRLPTLARPVVPPVPWPPHVDSPHAEVQSQRVVTFMPAETPLDDPPQCSIPPDEEPRLSPYEPNEPANGHAVEPRLDEAALRSLLDPERVDVSAPTEHDFNEGHLLSLVGHPVLDHDQVRPFAASKPSLFRRMLFGINRVYDRVSDTFWPFHTLLKWRVTRGFLGFVGLLLIAGSLVWLLVTQLMPFGR